MKDRQVKNGKIRHGIVDMSRTDRIIILKLGHKGQMRDLLKGRDGGVVGGQVRHYGGRYMVTLDQGDTKKQWRDWDLTLRGNVTR